MTQEDGLCDHCREFDCPTIDTWDEYKRRETLHYQRVAYLIRNEPAALF